MPLSSLDMLAPPRESLWLKVFIRPTLLYYTTVNFAQYVTYPFGPCRGCINIINDLQICRAPACCCQGTKDYVGWGACIVCWVARMHTLSSQGSDLDPCLWEKCSTTWTGPAHRQWTKVLLILDVFNRYVAQVLRTREDKISVGPLQSPKHVDRRLMDESLRRHPSGAAKSHPKKQRSGITIASASSRSNRLSPGGNIF